MSENLPTTSDVPHGELTLSDGAMRSDIPALARITGGELTEVLGWDQHGSLSNEAKIGITQIVRAFPNLNTAHTVDLLADIAGHHETDIGPWMDRLTRETGIDHVHLALECLYEMELTVPTGEHDKSDGATEEEKNDLEVERFKLGELKRGRVEKMIALIETVTEQNGDLPSIEQVENLIRRLGGWEEAQNASSDEVVAALEDPHYSL